MSDTDETYLFNKIIQELGEVMHKGGMTNEIKGIGKHIL